MSRAKLALIAALILPATAMVAPIVSSAASPADVIQARQQNFKGIGGAMKALSEELKKPAPDFAVIKAQANILAANAAKIGGGFPAGTGPEAGVKTAALPAIWQQVPQFQATAGKAVQATKALQAAAASGDITKVQAAIGPVGGACKECHQTFRAKQG